uniref:(northern house mosquito) hypothetical protein n=1 Tax=Culex pipiens TaxID=7175 RepID=A0A8D8EUU3_CULPI
MLVLFRRLFPNDSSCGNVGNWFWFKYHKTISSMPVVLRPMNITDNLRASPLESQSSAKCTGNPFRWRSIVSYVRLILIIIFQKITVFHGLWICYVEYTKK